MKFLTARTNHLPQMTIRRRRAVSDVVNGTLTLTETTLILTLPSFWQGIKDAAASMGDALLNALGAVVTPKIYAV